MKRKRSAHVGDASSQSAPATLSGVEHPVLQRLYPQVLTLRHYLLSRLPRSSKKRRRRISQLGHSPPVADAAVTRSVDVELGKLLDSALVGVTQQALTSHDNEETEEARDKDLEGFSQHLPECATGSTFKAGYFLQAEVVDFVIWLLFKRTASYRPSHILCHGFKRTGAHAHHGVNTCPAPCIPGLVSYHSNSYVDKLKSPAWCRLHSLLGPGGDRIMMDLLLTCGIFYRLEGRPGNFYQLSGTPISDAKPGLTCAETGLVPAAEKTLNRTASLNSVKRTPSAITFVRSRMLYARAALNAKGGVRFGMRHIHVLNRFPNRDDHQQTVHIMRYVFPRQFGLHNVFTSKVDPRETAMTFKDYTLREKEISQAMRRETSKWGPSSDQIRTWNSHVPKRLRGPPVALIDQLRTLNQRCAYMELLRHYCPVEEHDFTPTPTSRDNVKESAQPKKGDGMSDSTRLTAIERCFTDMACPVAHVSAFCRAVVAKVIPHAFWGDESNRRTIMYWIDHFISLRRFESLTLHQITQQLQISNLAWLQLPGQHTTTKMSRTDSEKRREVFFEFVYWLFDSFLILLIRSNFHVTESNVHRNRLFYFRHDVWLALTRPSLSSLKARMFEEYNNDVATKLLSLRHLGFSKIRLLPKSIGVRLITNLKRRQHVMRHGTMVLGRSINAVMAPVFNVITYEKSRQPDLFGSSLFSVGDMYPRLQSFRASLREQRLSNSPVYFAKVDVQSCFDTIPQQRLLSMLESLLSLDEYQTGRHVEVRPLGQLQRLSGEHVNPPPVKRYVPHSAAAGEEAEFDRLVQDKFLGAKTNTVFVDTAMQQIETKADLMHLLREHVERNMVKIGKKFFCQKRGIPQGSVLSSVLCNFFYAELEREVLDFAQGPDCLLLRLLDDFCLITTRRDCAARFVRVMHRGVEDYGVTVRPAKSLTNFHVVAEDGARIPQSTSGVSFPYCGVLINTRTLEVNKDPSRAGLTSVADSLTIDLSGMPGQSFHRKALNAFKIQLQAMFIDTSLNTVPTVLANLHQSFHEAAVRCFEYVRGLSRIMPTHSQLLIKTVDSIIALAYVMLQRRTRSRARQNVESVRSVISRRQVQWLACKAFDVVFQRRQTQHRVLLGWIGRSLAAVRPTGSAETCMLEDAIAWRTGRAGAGPAAEVVGEDVERGCC